MSISAFDDGCRNVSGLARIFGRDRRTIAKVIQQLSVPPTGRAGGHPTYAISSMAAALYSPGTGTGADDATPHERLDHWRAENERIKHEREIGQLINVETVRRDVAASLIKPMVAMLDTLPDRIEKHVGLSPEQATELIDAIDAARMGLYNELRARTEPPDDTPEDEK